MTRSEKITHISRLFLIFAIISFAGWVWEVIHVSYLAGMLVNRGFLFGPFCPIYGFTVILTYLLMGTPKEPQGILSFAKGRWYRHLLFIVAAIAIPTLIELIVGAGFDLLFGVRLWDYSHYRITVSGKEIPLHFMGYIALPISVIWVIGLLAIMGFVFPVLLKAVSKIKPSVSKAITLVLVTVLLTDLVLSVINSLSNS